MPNEKLKYSIPLFDLTTLRKPHSSESKTNVQHVRRISASKLFNLRNNDDDNKNIQDIYKGSERHLTRTFSQPNLQQNKTEKQLLNNFYTPALTRRSNTISHERRQNYDKNHYSRQLRTSDTQKKTKTKEMKEATGTTEQSAQIRKEINSTDYANLYELIQVKLKKVETEIEANQKVTIKPYSWQVQEYLNTDTYLQEDWERSIQELADSGKLDASLLEAIYLLRNAHKHGFFDDQYVLCETTYSSGGTESHSSSFNGYTSPSNCEPNESLVSSSQYSLESCSLPSSVLYSSSDNTPVNSSAPSSGRSTPSFRKRPKRPNIKIPDYRNYNDYIEICRRESICSDDSDFDGNGSLISNGSFMNIPEDIIAQAVIDSQFLGKTREFEETLKDEEKSSSQSTLDRRKIEELCNDRPGSPTSEFLKSLCLTRSEDVLNEIHLKLSPVLHKLKKLEDDSKKLSSLQVKLAVLQEEKRQLAAMLQKKHEKPKSQSLKQEELEDSCTAESINAEQSTPADIIKSSDSIDNESKVFKDASVQKYLELITEISHKQTSTDQKVCVSTGIGECIAEIISKDISTQNILSTNEFSSQHDYTPSHADASSETIKLSSTDAGVGDSIADLIFMSRATQESPLQCTQSVQLDAPDVLSKGVSVGCSLHQLVNTAIGDKPAVLEYNDQETQIANSLLKSQGTQAHVNSQDQCTSVGCSLSQYKNKSTQLTLHKVDFSCGDNIADLKWSSVAVGNTVSTCNISIGTDQVILKDSAVSCQIQKEKNSIAVGDGNVFEVICDRCSHLETKEAAVGCYITDEVCTINDKLCYCVKPECKDTSIGDYSIDDVCCDRCENIRQTSIGIGDDCIDDNLCDKCLNTELVHKGIGDCLVNDLLCDVCEFKGEMVDKSVSYNFEKQQQSIGVGDYDITNDLCKKCEGKTSDEDDIFNFDLSIIEKKSALLQQAILCHYCGNKVDLNDSKLDESLQAMRDSMQSISCGMKRSTASKNLNLEFENEITTQYSQRQKEEHLESPMSDEYNAVVSDDDDENSGRNDVIEACQMLHNHFSGEKPLKQQQMLKYMGIIQTLWFKTVKRRRANASVVKSYIDLFYQRIPELLETVMNMTDDEGNAALHYALTYKNYPVVSILLDSGECAVDLINQAGYTPIMLAALAGFEKKNDKYIMQRLLRMGDINKESADAGQTPLMLAVSRGNQGIVDLLLDAGCDINAIDDEGSTALMCACEHGNINIVKLLLAHPQVDATIEDNEGSTALSIAMDSRRKDLALLIYGSLNFDARGRIKLSPSKQSLLGLGRRSPSPVIGRR